MTKKIFIILVIAIALFSIQKTYAMTENDNINLEGNEKLETLIEINEEEWKDLEVLKYSEDNGIIYKLGSNERNTNMTISDEIEDTSIITILANGYGKKDFKTLGVSNSNDAYIATKIALDCVNKGIDKDNVQNHFRVKENLENSLKERAENIISAVKKLLSATKKDYFKPYFEIAQTGNIELDEFNEEYCSQKYQITTDNCTLKKYSISNYTDFISEVFSTNNEGVRKDTFTINEDSNIFRITMPKEYRAGAFEGKFKLKLTYEKNVTFFGRNGDNTYIVLTDKEEERTIGLYLFNRKSSIYITVNDKDKPTTVIENVKIKIKDENNLVNDTYISNKRGSIIVAKLGKGNVQMEILEVPQNYILEKTLYNKNLDYSEYCKYTISLKYKKGSLHINDNAKGAIFKIYNKNFEYIGTYQTDDNGQIQIDEINIGEDYILKQISVPDGFKAVEDSKFSILYNETTTIDILNEEVIKENQKEEDDEEDNDKTNSNDENSKLPSVDNGNGQEDNNNEEKQEQEDKKETPNIQQEEPKEQDKTEEVIENKEDIDKNNISNVTNNNIKNENLSLNKLPRTGYDLPEIKAWHLILIIFILSYILKRTAKSQSK